MPNLDFSGQNTLYATHGLHAYAAKCPPPLVRYALRYYSNRGDRVLDPMVGSGTTLVEARLTGRSAVGYDIDPLARLIAQVKTRLLVDATIEHAVEQMVGRVRRDLRCLRSARPPRAVRQRATPPNFPNRDYWFLPEVTETLALISAHIREAEISEAVRDFLWVAFSSLILAKNSVANARDIIHSRHHFRPHAQPPDVLGKFQSRLKRMRQQMAELCAQCRLLEARDVHARLGDARALRLRAESVDLVFTSPPYVTALNYPRAHFLTVAWMQEVFGVDLEAYRQNGVRYIGSERGALPRHFDCDPQLARLAITSQVLHTLAQTSHRHANLTQRYFLDMRRVLREIGRVLKAGRHAILVVCPSHIRRINVPTHTMLAELGGAAGLRLKQEYHRTIDERKRVLPYMHALGPRMSTEYVLIFQKVGDGV